MDESSDLFRSEKPEHDDILSRMLYLRLAIDNMNGADSWGRGEKRQRINERHRKARLRETPEERERQGQLGGGNGQ